MSERITRANLEGTAEALTDVLRRAGVVEGDQRFLVLSGPGGVTFRLTGGSLGSGHSEGIAGLRRGFHPARDAWETACTVIAAVSETSNAQRRAIEQVRDHAFHSDGEPCERATLRADCPQSHRYGVTFGGAL